MLIDVEDILEPRRADERGRVRVGPEFSGKELRLAIVEVIGESTETYPTPSRCAECGGAVQQFALVDGSALCLECADIETESPQSD